MAKGALIAVNSYEREQLLMDAESANLIQCQYCHAAQLLAGDYGWAGDEERGYIVRCRCGRIKLGYKGSPSEAVLFWNEQVKKKNPMNDIKELCDCLSDDNRRELIAYLLANKSTVL